MGFESGNLARTRCTFGSTRLVNSTVLQDLSVEFVFSEEFDGRCLKVYEVVLQQGQQMITLYLRVWMGIRSLLQCRLGRYFSFCCFLIFLIFRCC